MSNRELGDAVVERSLRAFIVDSFLFGQDSRFSDDDSFINMGILDSTGVLEIVAFVETTYDIQVEDHELSAENMDSIRRLATYVRRKRSN